MKLEYCPSCDKLFAKGIRDICNSCYDELDKDYERCIEYLRLNKGIHIQQLADDLEINIKQITRWIREGRISLYNAPNMSYPCESCGTLIREGALCTSCRSRLDRDMKNAQVVRNRYALGDKNTGAYQIGDRLKDRK